MADMFLKLEGIDGESKDAKHPKEIQILAWSWGASQPGSMGMGGGGGTGKVSVQDISFTKYIDSSSTTLMLFTCNGKHIPSGMLTVRKAGGEDPLEYFKVKFKDIIVTSVSTGGTGGDEQVTENVSISPAEFHIEYQIQTESGAGEPGGKMGWNVKENQAK